MSAFSEAKRAEITRRAGYRCEYCRLPTRGQVATFPIDHIFPSSAGGTNDSDNLALSCPHCNAHKWTAYEGVDPDTAETVPFFNPRMDDWDAHFEWSAVEPCELNGKTPSGRATVLGLKINDGDMIELRRLLAELGIFTESP